MPGTVSEVSATLVASTMRRALCGAKTSSCCCWLSRAKSGSTSTPGGWCLRKLLGGVADLALAGQEDEDVAGAGRAAAPRHSSSTASQIASPRSWSRLSSNGRQRISTG